MTRSYRWDFRILPLLLLLCFAGVRAAHAQLDTGSLAGTVTDATGAAIGNATVNATEQQSGSTYNTVTSSSGSYTFTSLRTGTYTINVQAQGFKATKLDGLTVRIGTRSAHDFALQVGSNVDTVTVEATGPTLESETSDIGTVITPEQVLDLPLATGGAMRSFSSLTFLAPGSVGPGTNGGTTYTKIGGGQTGGSDNLIDGISTQRSENGTEYFDQMTPSVNAIQEFRVESFALPAYLGRTTGGLANFKTRGGTNQYHGEVYDFYRNTILDANSWFFKGNAIANGVTQDADPKDNPPNPYRRRTDMHQDYGVTFGGPVYLPHLYNGRDKTFFFFSFEQVPTTMGASNQSVVPTAAQRNGDFSASLGSAVPGLINPCTDQPILAGQIFDPNTTTTVNGVLCRTPFANNQIPVNRSKVAQNVLALFPTPNYSASGAANFQYVTNERVNQTDESLRIDQNIGARHHLFAFGNMRENFDSGVANLPGAINSGSNQQDFYAKIIRVGWGFTISPHLINQLTVGGNRINSFNTAPAAAAGINYDAQLGIPNTGSSGTTFPVFNIGEQLPALGSPNFDDNVDNALVGDDNVTWQKGRHSIQLGGTYRWTQFSYQNNGPAAGTFNFARAQTAGSNNPTAEAQSGNSLASFLLGQPSSTGRSLQLHFPRWIQYYGAAYVQDDWKARQNLTLNLGFRYSVDTPRHEAEGAISGFDPTLPNAAANGILGALRFGGVGTGRDGNKNEQFANTFFKNFEPRVGFAYSPGWMNNQAVLRGSYTILYGPLIYSDYGGGLSQGFTTATPPQTNNPFLTSGALDAGPPNLPLTPTISSTLNVGGGVDYVAPTDGKPGMIQNWALELQQQLAPDLILSIGYLGQHGTRLRSLVFYENSLDQRYFGLGDTLVALANSPAAVAAGVKIPFANFFNVTNGAVGQALLPFPQYGGINNDSYLQNRGQSTYDALEVKLQRQFHNGLNLLASYTWSKTLTDADAIQPYFATILGQGGTQNPFDLKTEKAVSTQDVPTNFVISYLYELPVGKGKRFLGNSPRVVNAAIGGFRVGGIQRYLSGQPISFYGATGIPYFFGAPRFSRVQGQSFETPAAASGKYNPLAFHNSPNNNPNLFNPLSFFNRNAFVDVNDTAHRGTGAFRFGDLPRNTAEVRTPAYFNEDLNIDKNIPIREALSADLRLEIFNAFNRHGFGKPDSGVNDPNFGQITTLNDAPRSMQLELKVKF